MRPGTARNSEGDVVLIYFQDEPTVYARIEAIEPDVKKGWYRLNLLMLTLPPQVATWILREEYINGNPFTMGGRSLRIEAVGPAVTPKTFPDESGINMDNRSNDPGSKVIQLPRKKQ